MSEGIHGGHRDRMRQRYLRHGLDALDDHEALELLLYYAIPQADVNPLAHALIERFGSFRAVLDAPVAELTAVPGIGERTALLLHLVKDLNRRYLMDAAREKQPFLTKTDEAGEYLLPLFYGLTEERVYVAFLDDRFRLLSCRQLFEGGINYAPVSIRRIVEEAIRERATGVILAHNHPAGQAIPSVEDREVTMKIRQALAAVQIGLMDHLIIAGEEYLSMEESGYFKA